MFILYWVIASTQFWIYIWALVNFQKCAIKLQNKIKTDYVYENFNFSRSDNFIGTSKLSLWKLKINQQTWYILNKLEFLFKKRFRVIKRTEYLGNLRFLINRKFIVFFSLWDPILVK